MISSFESFSIFLSFYYPPQLFFFFLPLCAKASVKSGTIFFYSFYHHHHHKLFIYLFQRKNLPLCVRVCVLWILISEFITFYINFASVLFRNKNYNFLLLLVKIYFLINMSFFFTAKQPLFFPSGGEGG